MEKVRELDAGLLSEAILVWEGDPDRPLSGHDPGKLVERFGARIAMDLLPKIRELEEDFESTDAHLRISDWEEMVEVAASEFRSRHPEISDGAIRAFAREYGRSWL